jgi:hypothetical protein
MTGSFPTEYLNLDRGTKRFPKNYAKYLKILYAILMCVAPFFSCALVLCCCCCVVVTFFYFYYYDNRYYAGGGCDGQTATTTFERVRLLPYSLVVDICDLTFSDSEGGVVFPNLETIDTVSYLSHALAHVHTHAHAHTHMHARTHLR